MADTKLSVYLQESGAKKVQQALHGVGKSIHDVQATYQMMGQVFGSVSQKIDAAAVLVKRAWEFARAGAASRDIGESFRALGDAVPTMERLRDAVRSTVDDTSLQQYSILAEKLDLSASASARYAQVITAAAAATGQAGDAQDILQRSLAPSQELYNSLGISVDFADKKYAGMSEKLKKIAIMQDVANQAVAAGTEVQDTHLQKMVQTETTIANIVSGLQEQASVALENSGLMKTLGDHFAASGPAMEHAGETMELIGSILGDILPPILSNFKLHMTATIANLKIASIALKPLLWGLGVAGKLMTGVVDVVLDLGGAVADYFQPAIDAISAKIDALIGMLPDWAQEIIGVGEASKKTSAVVDTMARGLTIYNQMVEKRALAEDASRLAMDRAKESMESFSAEVDKAIRSGGDFNKLFKDTESIDTFLAGMKQVNIALQLNEARMKGNVGLLRAMEMARAQANTPEQRKAVKEAVEMLLEEQKQLSAEADALQTTLDKATTINSARVNGITATAKKAKESTAYLETLTDSLQRMAFPIAYLANSQDVELAIDRMGELFDRGSTAEVNHFARSVDVVTGAVRRMGNTFADSMEQVREANPDWQIMQLTVEQITDAFTAYGTALQGFPDLMNTVAGGSLEMGWIDAVMGAMLSAADAVRQFSMGNIPGGIGASIAAAKYVAAQAFAESKGAGSGGSSGAVASASAPATRPPSELDRGGRGSASNVTLMVDGRRLGEEAIRGANKAARSRSARLDPQLIGNSGWRDRF